MPIITIGIGLAKNIFAVHGVNENGQPALIATNREPRFTLRRIVGKRGLPRFNRGLRFTDLRSPIYDLCKALFCNYLYLNSVHYYCLSTNRAIRCWAMNNDSFITSPVVLQLLPAITSKECFA